jgi:hypothetical protein
MAKFEGEILRTLKKIFLLKLQAYVFVRGRFKVDHCIYYTNLDSVEVPVYCMYRISE